MSGGGGGGALADHGTGKRDRQAIWITNALGALLEEAEHAIGGSYEATVWQKLEDGTRKEKFFAVQEDQWLPPTTRSSQGTHVTGGQRWPLRVAG